MELSLDTTWLRCGHKFVCISSYTAALVSAASLSAAATLLLGLLEPVSSQAMDTKKALLEGLKDLVWKTCELEETIKNFGPDSQPILNDRLFRFIEGVRQLVPTASAVEGVQVPVDMLSYVDQGGNPHQYTAEVFQACIRDNQVSKGKVEAIQHLYDALTTELQQTQPDVVAEYQALVAEAKAKQQPLPPLP